jgi:hypothetical protein
MGAFCERRELTAAVYTGTFCQHFARLKLNNRSFFGKHLLALHRF